MNGRAIQSGRSGSWWTHLYFRFKRWKLKRQFCAAGYRSEIISFEGRQFQVYRSLNTKLPPLLFLHGFLDSALTFRRLTHHFSSDYSIILVDIPGFGNSKGPKQEDEWDLRVISRWLARLLAIKLRLTDLPVIAHSMGGLLALHSSEYARRELKTKLFSHFHLIAPGILQLKATERDLTRRKLFPTNHSEIKVLLENLYNQKKINPHPLFTSALLYEWTQIGYRALAENTVANESEIFYTPQRLKKFAKRITLYWGAEDRLVPLKLAHRIKRNLIESSLKVIKNGGHLIHLENSTELATLIRSSLK